MPRRRYKKIYSEVTDRYTDLNSIGLAEVPLPDEGLVKAVDKLSKKLVSLQMVQMVNARKECNCKCSCADKSISTVRQLHDLITAESISRKLNTKVEEVEDSIVLNSSSVNTTIDSDGAVFISKLDEVKSIKDVIDGDDLSGDETGADDIVESSSKSETDYSRRHWYCISNIKVNEVKLTRFITVITSARISKEWIHGMETLYSIKGNYEVGRKTYKITDIWHDFKSLTLFDQVTRSEIVYSVDDGYDWESMGSVIQSYISNNELNGYCPGYNRFTEIYTKEQFETLYNVDESKDVIEFFYKDSMSEDDWAKSLDQLMLPGSNLSTECPNSLSDDQRIRGCYMDVGRCVPVCPNSGVVESLNSDTFDDIKWGDEEFDFMQPLDSGNGAFSNSVNYAINPEDIILNATPTDQGGRGDISLSGSPAEGEIKHELAATHVWYKQAWGYDVLVSKSYSFKYVPIEDARIPSGSKVVYVYKDGYRETVIKD